jgi:hypothetical protein
VADADAAAARRRARIATRTAGLRTLGTAGAISALGVFTGLAAAHSPASTKPAAIAPPAADGVAPTSSDPRTLSDDDFVPEGQGSFAQGSEDADAQAAGDFFAQQSRRAVAPVQSYVVPPRPAAPPAAMSSTS